MQTTAKVALLLFALLGVSLAQTNNTRSITDNVRTRVYSDSVVDTRLPAGNVLSDTFTKLRTYSDAVTVVKNPAIVKSATASDTLIPPRKFSDSVTTTKNITTSRSATASDTISPSLSFSDSITVVKNPVSPPKLASASDTLSPALTFRDSVVAGKNLSVTNVRSIADAVSFQDYICEAWSTGALVENFTYSDSATTITAHNNDEFFNENLTFTSQACIVLSIGGTTESFVYNDTASGQKNSGTAHTNNLNDSSIPAISDSVISSAGRKGANPSDTLPAFSNTVTALHAATVSIVSSLPFIDSVSRNGATAFQFTENLTFSDAISAIVISQTRKRIIIISEARDLKSVRAGL